jgi:peptidoglycan hydrolase CwlO-like protein
MKPLIALLLAACFLVGAACAQTKNGPATPAVTREQLEKRLAELHAGREQALANVHAFDGAIQECQHWIDELKVEAAKSKSPVEAKPQEKSKAPEK